MTDTPAVVSLPFGLVLKCFFIFPATDNWWSFSHKPSSCTQGRRQKKKITHLWENIIVIGQMKSLHIVLTVTQGCSSTWRAVYLLSTSTSSMDRISSCRRNQTPVRFYFLSIWKIISNTNVVCFTVQTTRCPYRCRFSPWLFLTHCPSTVEEILAVP